MNERQKQRIVRLGMLCVDRMTSLNGVGIGIARNERERAVCRKHARKFSAEAFRIAQSAVQA